MNITQIVASIAERHGGPSRSVQGLAGGLAQSGHTVELLSTAPAGPYAAVADGRLSTRLFPAGWPPSLCPARRLRDHLAATQPAIIHHHGLWLRTLHYAHRAAAAKNVPLVISPRGMMSPWAWRHRRWKKRLASLLVHPGALADASAWHATSAAEADDIRRLGFNQPVCIAPNGVLTPSDAGMRTEAEHWRAALPPAVLRGRLALFYSRLHSKKRVIELIDLWLSRARGDWTLLIVGIPEEYSVNQIDAYIVRQGGTGRIIVHDGSGRPPPYALASLFLLPSHSENFGLVVAEALVRGVPVLATDGTPWAQLDREDAGRCVAWAGYGPALDALLARSPPELAAAGRRGKTWAVGRFDWPGIAATLAAFYASLPAAR